MTIQEKTNKIFELLAEVKQQVKEKNIHLYQQWKAGGFQVDSSVVSMYPDLRKVSERLDDEESETE